MSNEKLEQGSEQKPDQDRTKEKDVKVSRRKLLAALGMTGAALAAGKLLTGTAYGKGEELSVSDSVYKAKVKKLTTIPDDDVSVQQPITGAITRTQHDKNAENVSIADFGGQTDGVTDDTAPLAAAMSTLTDGGVIRQSGRVRHQPGTLPSVDIVANYRDFAVIGTDEKLANPEFTGSAAGWSLSGFTYGSNAVAHSTGSVGYVEQAFTVEAYTTYVIVAEVNSSIAGNIQLLIDGYPVLDSIQDYYLVAGSRTVQLGYFSNSTNGSKAFRFTTDTAWAGSVTKISIVKIANESEAAFVAASADDKLLRIPNMIKFGRFNASNVAIGDRTTASTWLYDSCWNIAIGARAQQFNQVGFENVAVGSMALQYNYASRNSAYGYSALRYNTSGQYNTGLGYKAAILNTEGSYNTAIGFHSGFQNTVGNQNTSVGYQAMYNSLKDSYNTAIGSQAGLNCAGDSNTFLGALSGYLNLGAVKYPYARTTSLGSETAAYGDENTAVGWNAHIGTQSAAVNNSFAAGTWSLVAASYATAVGDRASVSSGGIRATVIGQAASSSSEQGVSVGYQASSAGNFTTTLGSQAGINQTGTYATFVGFGAGNVGTSTSYTNITCLGAGSSVTAGDQLQLGNSSVTAYAYGAVQNRSDARDKADIKDSPLGLDFITKLRPRQYRWDYREDYRTLKEDGSFESSPKDGSKKRSRLHDGLIAQEVKETLDELNIDWGGFQDHQIKGGQDVLSIGYTELIGPLINAVKELKAEIDQLKAERRNIS
ncbi:tail fiber domain-containing protein [Paenibacillus contaminans]|uniref:Peptidase S74 domain-containing protein n=1 Tax=Paenibacillus contaminans TaxID=450362 RepID=A0A329MTY2_9BACL|nr:tail fiber domain-containing protein [Paenibacillus contaminans]RAV23092.1 hypothetical protein DQG23_02545 [Paenibacillus contaminans]